MKGLLEICCGSFEDVKTAWQNGADRVELNSALYLGGLTPSTANLICAKEQCSMESDKKKIQLAEPIKSFGVYEVKVKLHPQVVGTLKVKVREEK